MRLRIALTLDIRRDRHDDDGETQHDTTLDAMVEHAEIHDERPVIGFGMGERE